MSSQPMNVCKKLTIILALSPRDVRESEKYLPHRLVMVLVVVALALSLGFVLR